MTAAPTGSAISVPGAGLLQLTMALLLVVGLIFAVTWLARRFRLVRPRRSRAMNVIDEMALSPRDRVVLVQVGQSQWLLGVSPAGLTSPVQLATPVELPPSDSPGFADRMREILQRPGSGA